MSGDVPFEVPPPLSRQRTSTNPFGEGDESHCEEDMNPVPLQRQSTSCDPNGDDDAKDQASDANMDGPPCIKRQSTSELNPHTGEDMQA
mmetsp:Transcript_29047/g.40847  ORF Transcript_29047/g.40847 Transcript_29047/m.40847 type:complete len:89 (-) Transcript_29047:179-445(-)